MFTDREYKFSAVGNYPETCMFVRTANDDKNTASTSVQTTLKVPLASTIYLDFWGGSKHLDKVSSWIGSWSVASDATPTTFDGKRWGPGTVMKRDFGAGTVDLMGNDGKDHGTYYAFVCPQGKSVSNNHCIQAVLIHFEVNERVILLVVLINIAI